MRDEIDRNLKIASRNISIAIFFLHVSVSNLLGYAVLKIAAIWISPLEYWMKLLILFPMWLAYMGVWMIIKRRVVS